MSKFMNEFMAFLKEYNVIALAVAFVMALAVNTLIKSFVDNIIMPLVTPFIKGAWETATFSIGPIVIGWGAFLSAFLNFLIIALIIFIVIKKVMKAGKK